MRKGKILTIVTTVKTARGAITAHSGNTNEHFTNNLLNGYYDDLEKRLMKGEDIKSAHKKALASLKKKPFKEKMVRQVADLLVAHKVLGAQEMELIHEDSKKTATGVADHIVDRYSSHIVSSIHVGKSGPNVVKQITGLPSQADIIVETDQMIDFLSHRGLSLKYSKAKGTSIKIHSPTPNSLAKIIEDHYEQTFDKKANIHVTLERYGQEGLDAQQKALKDYHHTLDTFFKNLGDSKKRYSKLVDGEGIHFGGMLTREATSHLRDSDSDELRKIYEAMADENLAMKRKIAKTLFDAVKAVMDRAPWNDPVKESLLRSIANVQSVEKLTQLPTMIVSTDRDKGVHIFDVNAYLAQYIELNGVGNCTYSEGTSGFKLGPLSVSLDTRPTTQLNPITTFPVNVTMSCAELKKNTANK